MVNRSLTAEEAEQVAISALGYVAGDPELLSRFLAVTGIDAQRIREAAGEPGFLVGVLDFVMAHEPTLLAFAEASGINPADLPPARRALPSGDERYEAST